MTDSGGAPQAQVRRATAPYRKGDVETAIPLGEAGVVVYGLARLPATADRAALVELLTDNVRAAREREGCVYYAIAWDLIDPDVLHLAEGWTDMAALDASRFSDANTLSRDQVAALAAVERNVAIYTVGDHEAG